MRRIILPFLFLPLTLFAQGWNVELLGSLYNYWDEATAVAVSGNYAYAADWYGGLRVVNIADPSAPYETGYYNTPGSAFGVAVSGNYAYVADYYHFEIFDCSQALPVENIPAIYPSSFLLHPCFPNPFNAETAIRFSLPLSEKVSVKVFNTAGQTVAVLLSDYLEEGTHQVRWNAEGFSSGIYLLKVETASGFRASEKLVLLK